MSFTPNMSFISAMIYISLFAFFLLLLLSVSIQLIVLVESKLVEWGKCIPVQSIPVTLQHLTECQKLDNFTGIIFSFHFGWNSMEISSHSVAGLIVTMSFINMQTLLFFHQKKCICYNSLLNLSLIIKFVIIGFCDIQLQKDKFNFNYLMSLIIENSTQTKKKLVDSNIHLSAICQQTTEIVFTRKFSFVWIHCLLNNSKGMYTFVYPKNLDVVNGKKEICYHTGECCQSFVARFTSGNFKSFLDEKKWIFIQNYQQKFIDFHKTENRKKNRKLSNAMREEELKCVLRIPLKFVILSQT